LVKALADQLFGGETHPAYERRVDLPNATIGSDHDIAARGVLEEIPIVVDGPVLRHRLGSQR